MHITEVAEIMTVKHVHLCQHACCTNLLVTYGKSNSLLHGLPESLAHGLVEVDCS